MANIEKWKNFLTNYTRRENPTSQGNLVYNQFVGPFADRYKFDFGLCKSEDGWKQYDTDQDASYFGIWVHLDGRLIVTFAEGDITVVVCEDDAHLKAELESMERFYGNPPPAFVVVSQDGSVTNVYDERPNVEEKSNAENESSKNA